MSTGSQSCIIKEKKSAGNAFVSKINIIQHRWKSCALCKKKKGMWIPRLFVKYWLIYLWPTCDQVTKEVFKVQALWAKRQRPGNLHQQHVYKDISSKCHFFGFLVRFYFRFFQSYTWAKLTSEKEGSRCTKKTLKELVALLPTSTHNNYFLRCCSIQCSQVVFGVMSDFVRLLLVGDHNPSLPIQTPAGNQQGLQETSTCRLLKRFTYWSLSRRSLNNIYELHFQGISIFTRLPPELMALHDAHLHAFTIWRPL